SPAAVSFRYMIEAIKAFLEGEKYGEFQAWCKEKILKDFNETRKILKNLFLRYPEGFATINIETGRDLWNSEEERNKIERKNRDREKEKEGIRQKLRDSNSDIPPNEENIKRYLYPGLSPQKRYQHSFQEPFGEQGKLSIKVPGSEKTTTTYFPYKYTIYFLNNYQNEDQLRGAVVHEFAHHYLYSTIGDHKHNDNFYSTME
ncbi:25011_t:CDS:2, partial [Racocetra persica]